MRIASEKNSPGRRYGYELKAPENPRPQRGSCQPMTSVVNYTEFPGFEDLYLEEDSYVLGIEEGTTVVAFTVDAVLTPEHPQYHPPGPDEQNCYRRITITFGDVSKVNWAVRDMQLHWDPSGEPDLGIFYRIVRSEGYFELSGEFGEIHIYSDSFPRLEYE